MESGDQICGQTALMHDSRTLEASSRPDVSSHLFTQMLTHLDGSLCSCFNEHSVISKAHGCASPDNFGQHLGIEAWQSAQQACQQRLCALIHVMSGCALNSISTAVLHGCRCSKRRLLERSSGKAAFIDELKQVCCYGRP